MVAVVKAHDSMKRRSRLPGRIGVPGAGREGRREGDPRSFSDSVAGLRDRRRTPRTIAPRVFVRSRAHRCRSKSGTRNNRQDRADPMRIPLMPWPSDFSRSSAPSSLGRPPPRNGARRRMLRRKGHPGPWKWNWRVLGWRCTNRNRNLSKETPGGALRPLGGGADGGREPPFGTARFEARVETDRDERSATVLDVEIVRVHLPDNTPGKAIPAKPDRAMPAAPANRPRAQPQARPSQPVRPTQPQARPGLPQARPSQPHIQPRPQTRQQELNRSQLQRDRGAARTQEFRQSRPPARPTQRRRRGGNRPLHGEPWILLGVIPPRWTRGRKQHHPGPGEGCRDASCGVSRNGDAGPEPGLRRPRPRHSWPP